MKEFFCVITSAIFNSRRITNLKDAFSIRYFYVGSDLQVNTPFFPNYLKRLRRCKFQFETITCLIFNIERLLLQKFNYKSYYFSNDVMMIRMYHLTPLIV